LPDHHVCFAVTIYLQALGLSLLTVCSLNMAANGDVAVDAVPAAMTVAAP
jgi:hypothetical protein